MRFRVIDGCPCPASVAPYVARLLEEAGFTATSIYRGDDPAALPILHAHGKHTQRELSLATPAQRSAWGVTGTPNLPGGSMHELRSDGRAKRGPWGRPLQEWEIGVDAGTNTDETRRKLFAAAKRLGYAIHFPYNAAVEYHHFGFTARPRPRNLVQRIRIIRERARMARR